MRLEKREWIPLSVVLLLLVLYVAWGLSDPSEEGQATVDFWATVALPRHCPA